MHYRFILTQIQLVKNSSYRYNVIYNTVSPGWGAPPENTSVVLASNLECTVSVDLRLLANCHKSSREYNGPTNSEFNSALIKETAVQQNGVIYTKDILKLEVYSPELGNNEGGYAYPPQKIYPGRAELIFNLKNCIAK